MQQNSTALPSEEGRWAAFSAGSIMRDALADFRLRNYRRLPLQSREQHRRRRRCKQIRHTAKTQHRWAAGALLLHYGDMPVIRWRRILFRHLRAVVHPRAAAAGRQRRLTPRSEREERRCQRQAEDNKQQDGEKLTQYRYSSTVRQRPQRTTSPQVQRDARRRPLCGEN